MISMDLAEGAIKALIERIRAKPRQTLLHRLKLLDVHRRSNKQTVFNSTIEEIHTIFNVHPAAGMTMRTTLLPNHRWKTIRTLPDNWKTSGRRRSAKTTCSACWRTTAQELAPDSR
ncbi:protein of unknown function [Georgfuchsia toluolica]|uniref:Uncharacterized protein n=1 Tax=Georgfuchsia toluolica TaxID=424218 RepID=A0A916NHZ5_9PROT|nr:hypothetical protein [Georgfuchsia toluolica]CAG4883946.1 protein of unknown function [Georgfuchsia toluolica]